MRLISAACLAIATTALVGCATAPSLQGARPASASNQTFGFAKTEAVTRSDNTTKQLDEGKSIVYFQNQGGGGLGLGLLLGPLGVAANAQMIDSVTAADVDKLKGKLTLSPEAALQQAVADANFPLQISSAPADVKVAPYLLVSKTNETTIHISTVVLFEGMDGQNKWTRRYQYQLPGKYTLDALSTLTEARLSEIQAASVTAYAALLKHIAEEKDAAIAQEQKITLRSFYINPRFDFEMIGSLVAEKEGRVWVRTVTGVFAIEPSDIQYQANKS